jgi:hypothetical protein
MGQARSSPDAEDHFCQYGITQQELMREAFNLLFEKYGKARIA